MHIWEVKPHHLEPVIYKLFAPGEKFTPEKFLIRWCKMEGWYYCGFHYSKYVDTALHQLDWLKWEVGSEKRVSGSVTIYIYWYE